MKRLFILLFFAMTFTVSSFAQEVHGVETRVVTYVGRDYISSNSETYSDWNQEDPKVSLWFGYEITNMNSIPVSVEMKLYQRRRDYYSGKYGNDLCTTKTVVLQPKEKYIWKMESSQYYKDFKVYPSRYRKKTHPGDEGYTSYFLEYNAYKLL